MHRYLLPLLCLLLLSLPPGARAQEASLPADPPVRYDADVLTPAFHRDRRARLLEALPNDALAVVFSAPERNRENDVDFEYRQSSDLYYLTGTHEPESVLLLAPGGVEVDGERVRELLFVPPRSAMSEVWLGRRYGTRRAEQELGLQKAVSNERFEEILEPLIARRKGQVYHLPLPRGVDAQSGLGRQIRFLTERAGVLEGEGNYLVRNAVQRFLSVRSEAQFAQLQPFVRGRVRPDDLQQPDLRRAYEAFVAADSYADWAAWRSAHLDPHYADGITLREHLDALRMVKTDEELALLQRAIDITAAAHREAMRSLEPGMHEYEVEALVEYLFRRNGAEYTGFPSIVASGENSVILHYATNRRAMQAEDVVVIDIGAEYHGYTADITRTLPVDGVFSPEQRAINELVLRAQEAGIAAARAGLPFYAPHQAATQVIQEGLRKLGLLGDAADTRTFFMHGTSHYLGLYVHDVGAGDRLVPGAVITVEPGIYIRPAANVDPKWWNIGVRIEDDVLITDGDPVVLSAGAPRTVEDVEALMREQGLGNQPAGL